MQPLPDDIRYRVLKALEGNPNASQRDLAALLGLSLGKTNYCIGALIEKGLIKARNFKNSRNKLAYMYLLTPRGIEEKARVTYLYLRQKMAEAERLQKEIEVLRAEATGKVLPNETL